MRLPFLFVAVLIFCVALIPPGDVSGDASPRRIAFSTRTMGTYARVVLVDSDSLRVAPVAGDVQSNFARIDSLMTNWTETSEVARINREAGSGPVAVDPEVFSVVERALRTGKESNGAFDITVEPLVRLWGFLGGTPHVPSPDSIRETLDRVGLSHLELDSGNQTIAFKKTGLRIDLGGIAKGYGVESAIAMLRDRGVENALVEISGNIAVLGSPPDRERWTIGVRDPKDRLSYLGVLSLSNASVATSGKYEQFVDQDGRRYGHILNPRTGWPAEGLLSVTVVTDTATEADAWGTAFFALGPERAKALAKEREDLGVILVVPGSSVDTLWVEEQLRQEFRLEPQANPLFELRYF